MCPLAEDRRSHPRDDPVQMAVRQMGIPLHHSEGLVPQELGNLQEAGAGSPGE
jgi:hypothetical protein